MLTRSPDLISPDRILFDSGFSIKFWMVLLIGLAPYSKLIPLEDRIKIKEAVLDAHNHGEIGGYGGKMSHYMEVKDSDYDVLREVIELLKKNKS